MDLFDGIRIDKFYVCVEWLCNGVKGKEHVMSAQRNAIPVYFPDEGVWKWLCCCAENIDYDRKRRSYYGDCVWTSGNDDCHVPRRSVPLTWFIHSYDLYEKIGVPHPDRMYHDYE